ncbi:MAG TPA: M48 family metallopeptidase [Candidatus Wunengus sp. YC60]|uniref:M48 family metallopeptidase n=1 Tax=Candidatus Wunengus sp. YC60 TaxID=3367697 RepID=UPI004028997B
MEKYLTAVFILYLLAVILGYWLKYLNLSYLKKYGASIPPEFEGHIDQSLLNKTRDYVIENTKFEVISSIFHTIILLIFLFGNLLNVYNSWIVSLKLPFILSGLVFFFPLLYAETLLAIPFSLYHTFKIENKYGFTTTTLRLWATDSIKSLVITTILLASVTSAGLLIIQASPNLWWLWVWCLFLVFSIVMMYAFPYVIEPLFNKFTPIENETLREGIHKLMQKVGIQVKRVFKMDSSKRTKHTNAYFTGIGKVKRIILYDTLLEKMDNSEILSVLAHEAGHWKKRHLLKHLIASELIALIAMYLSFKIFQGDFLIHLFHLKESTFFAKVILVGFIGSIAAFPFTPVFNYFSRRHEIEADRFSYELTGNSQSMVSTLVKLSKDNLSNLHPHPLYAAFHYSHPPVLERIRKLREMTKNKDT